jgi:hypothetical protein
MFCGDAAAAIPGSAGSAAVNIVGKASSRIVGSSVDRFMRVVTSSLFALAGFSIAGEASGRERRPSPPVADPFYELATCRKFIFCGKEFAISLPRAAPTANSPTGNVGSPRPGFSAVCE